MIKLTYNQLATNKTGLPAPFSHATMRSPCMDPYCQTRTFILLKIGQAAHRHWTASRVAVMAKTLQARLEKVVKSTYHNAPE